MVPAFTWSPAATGSEVTVPLTANDRSERRAGAMVPEAETLSRMVLLVALTRVGAAVPDDDHQRDDDCDYRVPPLEGSCPEAHRCSFRGARSIPRWVQRAPLGWEHPDSGLWRVPCTGQPVAPADVVTERLPCPVVSGRWGS